MNTKRIITSVVKSILVLMFLVGGLGFTQISRNESAAAEAPEPYLVKDINTRGISSEPEELTNVNGTLFFSAEDGIHGWELWKSDGTAEGTVLVKDINPGGDSSGLLRLTNVNGMLFFIADDGVHGFELWVSDGTAGGTQLVKDINPGIGGSCPVWECNSSDLTNMNGMLFFSADDGVHGTELWKSDGTAEGTILVKDIYPGLEGSGPGGLTNINGTLFFSAWDSIHHEELWKSDGTVEGTVLVKDISLVLQQIGFDKGG